MNKKSTKNLKTSWLQTIATSIKTKTLLLALLVVSSFGQAQTQLSFLPQPDATVQNGQVSDNSIEYDGNFYYLHKDSGGKTRLAKYDGTNVTFAAANPDNGSGFFDSPIVYNGNLYYTYRDASNKNRLVKFNGTTITFAAANPDNGLGFVGFPIVYNGKLYYRYTDASSKNRLAKFDGTTITLAATNPDGGNGFVGSPIVYNSNLYFRYSDANSKTRLVKFDETTFTFAGTNPDAGYFTGSPIVYNGNLFYQYNDASNKIRLAKYDGTNVSFAGTNPDNGYGFQYSPIVYNGNLYSMYINDSNIGRLVKYDGTNITFATTNPVSGAGVQSSLIDYSGSLYFSYLDSSSKFRLAKYDGTNITIAAANPDAGNGIQTFQKKLTAFGGNLYFGYSLISNKKVLAKFDGNSITLPYTNPNTSSNLVNVKEFVGANQLVLEFSENVLFKLSAATFCTSTPLVYNVTGGGAYCAGGAGVAIGLSNSETGVTYQLKNGATNVGSPLSGTGAAISFGNQTAIGTYTVVATRTADGCSATMTGSPSVSHSTTPPTASAQTFCGGAATVANLVATGTALQWYAAATGGSPLATTTTLATSTYYVSQTLNGCESTRTAVTVTIAAATVDLSATLTATATTACAGTITATAPSTPTNYSNTFPSSPTGATSIGFDAFWESGSNFIKLTANQNSKKGYLYITNAPSYSAIRPNYLELNFRAFMLNQSGADGFSVNISPNIDVNTSNNFENGILNGNGVVIRFKTWNQDQIELVNNGTVISSVNNYTLEDGNWKDYKVTIKPDNTLTLTIAGTTIFNNVALPGYTNLNPNIAFAARTGGSSNEHIIDDVVIKDLRPYEYSLDNSTYQNSNVFTNQIAGTFTVYGRLPGMTCGDALGNVTVTLPGVAAPTATATQVYTGTGTIANLTATGTALQWYAAATGGTALATSTALVSGTTYYVSQTVGTCESPRTVVKAQKISESTQTLCGPATVANLVSTPTSGNTSAWFTNASGGTALAGATALVTGTYYVEQQIPVTISDALGSGFNNNRGLAIQADGKIVVADGLNNAVKRMNADGSGIVSLGSGFSVPIGVAIQADGKIVIGDNGNNALKRMDANGLNIETLDANANFPRRIAIQADGKIIYSANNQLRRRNSATDTQILINNINAMGVAIDASNNILVVDQNSIKKINNDGSGLVTLTSGLNNPADIVIQTDGKIVFTDTNNSKLKRMNADGTNITDIANITASGVAIEADGKFIVSSGNSIFRITEATVSNRVAVNVVVNTVNNAVTQTSGVLTATQTGATYQWYKCPSTFLTGANNQNYTPTVVGDYKVEVTVGGCMVTSSCVTVATLDNTSFDKTNFSFYPNPTSDSITLDYATTIESVSVMNLLGQLLFEKKTNSTSVQIDLSNLPAATYLVKVKADGNEKIIKVLKQ